MKKLMAFDIDDTLNVAKTPMTDEMGLIFAHLLDYYAVCVISGQKFEQFLRQIIEPMHEHATVERLRNLHLMVAQGTQYYTWSGLENNEPLNPKNWRQVYSYPLTSEQVQKIDSSVEQAAKELGYWCEHPAGEVNEDRISQVTFSALGQAATPEDKYKWDPDHHKREAIVKRARELAPEFDYEIGGTTSINIFLPGMNKTFGMQQLMDHLNLKKSDILYFGDMTQPGGNDYPVMQMGIDTLTVTKWQDTVYALKGIIAVSKS